MKKLSYLLIALFLIIFEAVPEGLALGGHKSIAGIVEVIYLFVITISIFEHVSGYSFRWWKTPQNFFLVLVGYILLRFAIFDIIHNLSAGLPVFYIGSTKLFDIIMAKLGNWGWFVRLCCVLPGIAFLMEWQYGIRSN